jgi:hypothetical protein
MPVYRFYVSRAITDPSPPFDSMDVITADSQADAARRLAMTGRIPADGPCWVHFVACVDAKGVARGFNSVCVRAE